MTPSETMLIVAPIVMIFCNRTFPWFRSSLIRAFWQARSSTFFRSVTSDDYCERVQMRLTACLRVIGEPRVDACSSYLYVTAICHVYAPCGVTIIPACAAEVRISVESPDGIFEWSRWSRHGLIVWRLGLNHPSKYVLRSEKVVLIKN